MIVCVCHNISERRVRKCIDAGARCVRDLRDESGLGSSCGKCVQHARALLNEAEAAERSAGLATLGLVAA
ncbi:(2Fe-2S)-binding protein [Derxia lacustris]|uniref:(2Fe-2S)-binding protein n=1 Tax=Derxia lacustris TaxID=764842 RepID=UPI000A173B41|nr:(2Fe-2S)-binding protein [Derxia lacustris]